MSHLTNFPKIFQNLITFKRHSHFGAQKKNTLQLTMDPTRLELIGANESLSMHGEQKLMASKESDNPSDSKFEMESSVTNTHCFF